MTSPAGPRSHFLWRWMPSSSRAGVFLNGSPEEVDSVRSSCSSPGVDMSLEDSFSAQFAPLPMSRSSSCLSVDSICPSQSSSAPVSTPSSSAPVSAPSSSAPVSAPSSSPAARNPQVLLNRLQELKQLQQCMQEQLKSHQQEQLQKLQNEHSRLLGMVQTATENHNIQQPYIKSTEQSGSSHTRQRDSPLQLEHQQPNEVERTLGPNMWNPDPSVDQASSGHHSDDDYHEEESLHSEDKSLCQKGGEAEPHDRPISSGGSGKTFEEMLEEQLKLENEKLSKISARSQFSDGPTVSASKLFKLAPAAVHLHLMTQPTSLQGSIISTSRDITPAQTTTSLRFTPLRCASASAPTPAAEK